MIETNKQIQRTLDNQYIIPKWGNIKNGVNLDHFLYLYESDTPLTEICESLGCSITFIHKILDDFDISPRDPVPKRPYRLQLQMLPLEKNGSLQLFQLRAAHCDYLIHNIETDEVELIEEKKSLSKFNIGTAITQLVLADRIFSEMGYTVSKKTILTERIKGKTKDKSYMKTLIEDAAKYLNICVTISDHLP